MRNRRVLFLLATTLLGAVTWGALVAASRPRVDVSALALLEASDEAAHNLRSVSCDMETRWDNERRLTKMRVLRPGYAILSRRIEKRATPGLPWTPSRGGNAAHIQNGVTKFTILESVGKSSVTSSFIGWSIEPNLSGVCDNGLWCGVFKPERSYLRWINRLQNGEERGGRLEWLRDAGRATVDGVQCRVIRLRVRATARDLSFADVLRGRVSSGNWSQVRPLSQTYEATIYIAEADHMARRETMVFAMDGISGTRDAIVRNLRINPNLRPADFPAAPPPAGLLKP